MGREIKRVALDFNWPLDERWKGFLPPDSGMDDCPDCRVEEYPGSFRATGYSALGRALHVAFRNRDLVPCTPEGLSELELELINKLVENDRYAEGILWFDMVDGNRLAYCMMKTLSSLLGLEENAFLCPTCKGKGMVVVDQGQNDLYKAWEPTEPPAGDGWQVWETVSEGSPITPVFATAEELIDHLVSHGTTWDQRNRTASWGNSNHPNPTRAQAEAFVLGSGWVPSAVIVRREDGQVDEYLGIQSATEL